MGLIGGVLVFFGLFLGLFKIAEVGSVGGWSWWLVLSPWYPFVLVLALGALGVAGEAFGEWRRDRHSFGMNTEEGAIAEFFRKRRAERHAKDQRRWGVTK
jgi:hypothetical protein